MALRLVEVLAPVEELESIRDLLEDQGVIDLWTSEGSSGRGVVRVLLEADNTETVSDLLREYLGGEGSCRIVVYSVESTVPRPGRDAEEEAVDEGRSAAPEAEPAPPARISREELDEDIREATRLTGVYLVTVALSTIVAAVGLMRGDVAVIIGAMVIAPLLGPNIALSLASTLGDGELARTSLRTNVAGLLTALVLAYGLGMALLVDPSAPEILSRTQVGWGDIALALAAGSAGSLAYTTGLPTAIIGVMVAVALLPPLVATGLLAGSGEWGLAGRAAVLVVTNVVCVNLAAVATFLAQKVRPRTWWEEERARKATRFAIASWLGMLLVLAGVILFLR